MPKGLFTQGMVVLTDSAMSAESVNHALEPFGIKKRAPAEGEKNWISGYETWVLPYRPEKNGYVVVDLVDAPWPDQMGSPKEAMLFGAWSTGFLGPFTFPGNLQRATFYTGAFGRKDLAEAAGRHQGFVRIRSSYALGANGNTPLRPDDYDPTPELALVVSVAKAIASQPGGICCFSPGGESLHRALELEEIAKKSPSPLGAMVLSCTSGRMMRIDDAPQWYIADVVGMEQLEGQDHEAVARRERHNPAEVIAFLMGVSCYGLEGGNVIKDGHTADGPGGRWRAFAFERAMMDPPRRVLRWFPDDGSRPPAQLLPQKPVPAGRTGLLGRLRSLFGS